MASRNTIFGILSIVVGLSALTIGAKEWVKISRIKSNGLVSIAQTPSEYTKRKSGPSTTYSAEFTFKTQAGDVITRRHPFPSELLSDFKSGNPVKIIYDPGSPGDFVFEKDGAPWLVIFIGIAFLVTGPVLIRRKSP